jgi:hypothetical protein
VISIEAPKVDPLVFWATLSAIDKSTIFKHEGRAGLAKLLPPMLMLEIASHFIGQHGRQILNGSTKSKQAQKLTAILRNVLAVEGYDEPIVRFLRAQLASFELSINDIAIQVGPSKRVGQKHSSKRK